jgi:hypothetical protein
MLDGVEPYDQLALAASARVGTTQAVPAAVCPYRVPTAVSSEM